jgi:hypothetical protein
MSSSDPNPNPNSTLTLILTLTLTLTLTYTKLSQEVVFIIISFWGVFWALPFGPAGASGLNLSGTNHAALFFNLFDAAGFLFASILSYYVLEMGKIGEWRFILFSLSMAGLIALGSMWKAMMIQIRLELDID